MKITGKPPLSLSFVRGLLATFEPDYRWSSPSLFQLGIIFQTLLLFFLVLPRSCCLFSQLLSCLLTWAINPTFLSVNHNPFRCGNNNNSFNPWSDRSVFYWLIFLLSSILIWLSATLSYYVIYWFFSVICY